MNENKKVDITPYFKSFNDVYRAGCISYIDNHVERFIDWDIYSATIYNFLFSRFQYHEKLELSQEYISSELNISMTALKRRLNLMKEAKIITIKSNRRSFGGTMKVNHYVNVVDLVNDNSFKIIVNKYKKDYLKKLKIRKERLQLLKGIVIKKEWTQEQRINFYHNKNYELLTNTYLEGDKLNEKLYLKVIRDKDNREQTRHNFCNSFNAKDELKVYEVDYLLENSTTGDHNDG